jgi:pyruvate dehydrogenase E1 component beta subunit
MGRAVVRRQGKDVTLLAYGSTVATALESAEAAQAEEGWDVEVIDLRSLSPLDTETVCASVRKTGRAAVVHEAPVFGGYGAEVAATVTERCFHYLEAPVARIGGFDIPYPAPKLEGHYLPDTDRILDAIAKMQWER